MSDVFNIKRFFRFLSQDLRLARGNYLLSILICGCLPAMAYFFSTLFGLIFTGSVPEFSDVTRFVCLGASAFICILTFPSKQYGHVTDKRYGSDYLMLPASTLEKFLSCLVVSCVFVPVILFLIFFGVDSFMSLLAPKYGSALLPGIVSFFQRISEELSLAEFSVKFNFGYILYLSWCENILVFVLGAMIFKRSKVAKTILAIIGLSMVLSSASVVFLKAIDFSGLNIIADSFEDFLEKLSNMDGDRIINAFMIVKYFIGFAFLDLCIFFRLKTLKH